MPHKSRRARLAYQRRWKEMNRPSPEPLSLSLAMAPLGALRYSSDGTKVQCHCCGRWYGSLNMHLHTHGIDAAIYKEIYGLARTASLWPPALVEKQRQAALDRDQGAIGRQYVKPGTGRTAGQEARLSVRIAASMARKGIYTRGGAKTRRTPCE